MRARGSTFVVPTPANENPNLYHVQPNEGEVLADGGEDVGFITAKVDPAMVEEARTMIPALRHDREFSLPLSATLRAAGE